MKRQERKQYSKQRSRQQRKTIKRLGEKMLIGSHVSMSGKKC